MKLESYVSGEWKSGSGEGRVLVNPVTGAEIARADASGIGVAAAMVHAREVGGPALRSLGFAERGALLKAVAEVLGANRERYGQIARENSGNTETDAAVDIDGGIFTLKHYARIGKTLGDATMIVEDGRDQLARDPVFFGQHTWTTRPGVAVQINAFNFPSWGLWEKAAVAILAGVPCIAKPATATALLSHEMVRDVIAAGVLPEGALSLVCGGGEALLTSLGPMDSVAFTGSASTAATIRSTPSVLASGARLNVEADSVNATILGPDAAPGTAVFDLAVREAVKALSVKAGQLCTNIRRVFVPAEHAEAFGEAVAAKLSGLTVGDPADDAVRVGPLINRAQREDAEGKIARLAAECTEIARAPMDDWSPDTGFVAPRLMHCADPAGASAVHEIEVFGPCATLLPYDGMDSAVAMATAAEGSLALSLFSSDPEVQMQVVRDLGPWNGRILCVDEEVGKNHTGHSIVVPQCVHGGPGRAGGGEELGGLRGLRFHMQRTAIQGGPGLLDRIGAASVTAGL
ncbi:3,4-dehydroadipyl-CoA semialdehyde dehydrogenase [Rhodobacterales bacterium HKCCE2091]|nr:3,4-dehydroadipyl-CoA semialdehyde dehydrogenase [Rhodobacterales bacterium HKCCE2091]